MTRPAPRLKADTKYYNWHADPCALRLMGGCETQSLESFCFFVALFTYFLIPDKTTHANSMNLRIQSEKPGFKTKIIKVPLKDYKGNFFIGSEKIYKE